MLSSRGPLLGQSKRKSKNTHPTEMRTIITINYHRYHGASLSSLLTTKTRLWPRSRISEFFWRGTRTSMIHPWYLTWRTHWVRDAPICLGEWDSAVPLEKT